MADTLTVIIATGGRAALLDRTLASLSTCGKPAIYHETIVVENGPKGQAEAICRPYRAALNLRYLHVPPANKCAALNAALERVDEGLVYFTDDDVRFDPEVLCAFADAAQGVSAGQFYGGPTGTDYEDEPPGWLRPYLPASARGWALNGIEAERQKWFLGFNWAAFAQDIKSAGGFNDRYGPGASSGSTGDEKDMQMRLVEHGVARVFVPGALVWHHVPLKRSTAAWVLERNFRDGVFRGLRVPEQGPLWFGYPRAMLGEGLWLLGKALVKCFMGKRHRFDGHYHLNFHRGVMHGYRLKQSRQRQNVYSATVSA